MGFRVKDANKWPDGIVPYVFKLPAQTDTKNYNTALQLKEVIEGCMAQWARRVNADGHIHITFVASTESDFSRVKVIKIDGSDSFSCTSGLIGYSVGDLKDNQMRITLARKDWYCIPHELGHVLGLAHENERNPPLSQCPFNQADGPRMCVDEKNGRAESTLRLRTNSQAKYVGFGAYDVNSIMHYPPVGAWRWNGPNDNINARLKSEDAPDTKKEGAELAKFKLKRNYPTTDEVVENRWEPSQGDVNTLRNLYPATITTAT